MGYRLLEPLDGEGLTSPEETNKNEEIMEKRNNILAIMVLLVVASASAQTVTNVTAKQVGENVPAGHHKTTVWDVLAKSKCVLPHLSPSEYF